MPSSNQIIYRSRKYLIRFVWLVLLSVELIGDAKTAAQTLDSHPPTGALDAAQFDGVAWGWALDVDIPNHSSLVDFYVDGNHVGRVTANLLRPDVNLAKSVEGNHGFVFSIPLQFHDGKTHTLKADVINTAGGTNPLIGEPTFKISATSPRGTIDGVNADGSLWGWTFDRDNTSPSLFVHFYVDQHPGNLDQFEGVIGSTKADRPRSDVNQVFGISGNHGYEFTIPWYLRDGRTHTLYAYGIDTNGGTNTLLATKTFNFPPAARSGLKYFGYFASANDGEGTGDYTNQIADHANVTWIDGNEVRKLQDASARNMKAVMHVVNRFFYKVDGKHQLRPEGDYLRDWRDLSAKIKPYANVIAAFYPIDEPYWHEPGCSMEIKSDIEKVIGIIKADFPTIPVAVFFAIPCVTSDLIIPNGYDWVGFDCYQSFVDCGQRDPHQSASWYATTLLSRMIPNQRLILAPDAWHKDPNHSYPPLPYQNELALRAEQYYSLALSEPRVIGMFNFIYQNFAEGTGTQDMPIVLDRWTRIGKEIKASIAGH